MPSTGSVYQRKDGYWVAAVQSDGIRKTSSAKTERGARQKLAKLQGELATVGALPQPGRRTMNDLLDQWLATVKPTLKPSTVAEYEKVCDRHIRPALGKVKLTRLTPERLQLLTSDLQARGLDRTAVYVHGTLHRAFEMAKLWRWLPENVADRTIRPRYQAPSKEVWTACEVRSFLAGTQDHRLHPLWTFLLTTGCRLGEALALEWNDLDLQAGHIHVRRTVRQIGGDWVRTSPKTKAGERTITLPSTTTDTLRRQRAAVAERRLRAGESWHDEELVFPNETGQPMQPCVVGSALRSECARLAIRSISPHTLRHQHATLLLAGGLPVPTVSARLGHSRPSITMSIYAHALPDGDEQAADAVAKALAW